MNAAPFTISLGDLLRQYRLGLAVIAGSSQQMLDAEVQWVHASELEDPTPFLPPRTVLLTTGARFTALQDPAEATEYVGRLVAAGTTAIGFAVGLHWDRVPAGLVAACDEVGLPLFRVPYDTAFIAIVQTAAALLDDRRRERDVWALDAQRAISRAAQHDDALEAILHEASARLRGWVWVAGPAGRTLAQATQPGAEMPPTATLRREVLRITDRGLSSVRVGMAQESGFRIQRLGRPGRVLGILAVEDRGAPDTAERTVIELLAALTTAQLEHRGALHDSRAALRDSAVDLYVRGHVAVAERLLGDASSEVPREPFAVMRAPSGSAHMIDEALTTTNPRVPLVHADHAGAPIVVVGAASVPLITPALASLELPIGVSSRSSAEEIATLLQQADRALAYAIRTKHRGVLQYHPSQHDDMLQLLHGLPAAETRAQSVLAPVRTHDERHNDTVEQSLTVWLKHHGQLSAASSELGVHRHTLRGRVALAAELLQLDIDSADVRAELWAALRLTSDQAIDEPRPTESAE